jgi:hypothetical protein
MPSQLAPILSARETSMERQSMRAAAVAVCLLLAAREDCGAQQNADALAKASQNPVADMTSFPLQFNFNSGGGLQSKTALLLNVQPVMPLELDKKWLLVARTVVPYVNLPLPDGQRQTGIADIQEQLFFTPRSSSQVVWGLGPILSVPTATSDVVRTGQWALGPTGVALVTKGRWVVGMLANQLWRIGGDNFGNDVNQFLLQPFVNFNIPKGWSITSAPIITANWNALDDKWTVPLGIGVGKVTAIGHQPVSIGMQYYRNVEHPDLAGANQFRFTFTPLFPIQRPQKPEDQRAAK